MSAFTWRPQDIQDVVEDRLDGVPEEVDHGPFPWA
jgi:hypothetical protein